MPSSNPKQSGSKAPANLTSQEYMDTAAEVMDTAANSVKAPKPSNAGTQPETSRAVRSPERAKNFFENDHLNGD